MRNVVMISDHSQAQNLFAPAGQEREGLKIQIHRDAFLAELELLAEVVEPKNRLLAYSHLRMEAAGDRVILQAAGFKNALQCEAEALVLEEGVLCLPARKLREILRQLPSEMLTLNGDGSIAALQWGNSRFKINALSPDEFPEVPANDDFDLVIPREILLAMIRSTLFAAGKDDGTAHYALNGARLIIGSEGARMIATDGHRLSYMRRADVRSDQTIDALIPRDALSAIPKLIGAFEGEVKIGLDENRIYFRTGARRLSCLLLTGQYPNCESLLSQTFDQELKIDAARFKEAIARMSIFGASNSSQMFGLIKFHFAQDICEMLSADHNGGEGQEEITLLSVGPEQEITLSFNGRYLQDFARTVSGSALVLKYNDENSSVEFSLADTNNEKYILMPCR